MLCYVEKLLRVQNVILCTIRGMRSLQLHSIKGIQAVRIAFFLFILKVANIRCFILIKCSEQKPGLKNML